MKSLAEVEAYIDGSSLGNPGPAGIGIVFVDAHGKTIAQLYKYLGEATNNIAEYLALLYALQEAQARDIKQLLVKTDSELLAKQFNGQYKVRDGMLRIFYEFAAHAAKAFERLTVEHIDRSRNAQADRLAAEAIESRFDTSLKTVIREP